ncbi:hypothetical protein DI388_23755 [Escherichia coli]|nr:hypothetical protein DI388_23755 [Escherichia coli]
MKTLSRGFSTYRRLHNKFLYLHYNIFAILSFQSGDEHWFNIICKAKISFKFVYFINFKNLIFKMMNHSTYQVMLPTY